MKVSTSAPGVLAPGVLAGLIYLVIAVATGAAVTSSLLGGVVIAVIAVAIGMAFRELYKRTSRPGC